MTRVTKKSKLVKTGEVLSWLLDHISYVFLVISGVMILVMAICDFYGVLMRYAFNKPDPYAYLIIQISMLGSVLFALSHAEKLGRHVSVGFIADHLPVRVQNFFQNIIGPILGLVFCGVVIWMSLKDVLYALHNNQTSIGIIEIPTAPVKLMVPIGLSLVCFMLIAKMLRYIFHHNDEQNQISK